MASIVDCPQSDLGEWRFDLFGVPVRVKLWFWAACLITCYGLDSVSGILIWIGVCFVSILLHEMGHAMALRSLRTPSDVVLYGWGGLTIPTRPIRGTVARVAVSLAGPAAGFALAAAVLVGVRLAGWPFQVSWTRALPSIVVLPAGDPRLAMASMDPMLFLVNTLLRVNLLWGMVNLLPIYPLDGGQVARALMEQHDPYTGRRKSLILSVAACVAVGLIGLALTDAYVVILFAVLAVASLQCLEQGQPGTYRRY